MLDWNPTFAEVTTRLCVTVEVCWPYRANQKGSVENLVGWMKGSFFKLRAGQLDLRFPVRVGPTGMVTWETNRHSMPTEALGYASTLHLFCDRVVIVASTRACTGTTASPLAR